MSMEDRVTRLERSVRLWQLIAVLPLIAIVVFAMVPPEKVAEEMRARAFVVVDDEGEELVRLDDIEGRGRIRVSHQGGEWTSAIVSSKESGGTFALYRPDGENFGVLMQGFVSKANGQGMISVSDGADGYTLHSLVLPE